MADGAERTKQRQGCRGTRTFGMVETLRRHPCTWAPQLQIRHAILSIRHACTAQHHGPRRERCFCGDVMCGGGGRLQLSHTPLATVGA